MASKEDTFKDINPLLAAFEVGLCINKLRWHQAQALVTEDNAHKNGVVEELARIAGFLIPLDPNNRGGRLRDAISLFTEDWQQIFSGEGYADCFCELRSNIHDHEIEGTVATAIDAFLRRLPDYGCDLKIRLGEELFGKYPILQNATSLGECIDQGRHSPEVGRTLIEWRLNPDVWSQKFENPHLLHELKQPTEEYLFHSPADVSQENILETKCKQPFEVAPTAIWANELMQWLKVVIKKDVISTPAPECLQDPKELKRFVEQAIQLIRQELLQSTNDKSQEGDKWPPDGGWHFQDRRYAIGGQEYPLKGLKMKLLTILGQSRRAWTSDELIAELWPDKEAETKDKLPKLSNLKFQLNRELEKQLNLKKEAEVVHHDGSGRDAIWRLTCPVDVLAARNNSAD